MLGQAGSVNVYTLDIDGVDEKVTSTDIKKLWSYIIKHYDKLDLGKNKLANFNGYVIKHLTFDIHTALYDKDTKHKIDNLGLLNNGEVKIDTSKYGVALQEVLFDELKDLPNYVSEQVIVRLVYYLEEDSLGLYFGRQQQLSWEKD